MNKTSSYSAFTQPPAPATKPPRKPFLTRKRVNRAGVVLLVIALTGSIAWGVRAYRQHKLLASLQQDPRKAFDAAREGKISREQAREIMQESWEKRMDKQLDDYFALPEKDRTKYLDKQIDEMQARMREWQSRAATQPSRRPTTGPATRPNRDRGGDQVARMRGRIETGDPARKAQRAEYMAAMRQLMAQRGIQGPGGGGRGGWGGGGGFRGGGGGGGGGRGGGR
jgi:hypothetical protein